jgi:hypothetical protein
MNVATGLAYWGALDLTWERIRQLQRRGMPTDSVEAAAAWRAQHVKHARNRDDFAQRRANAEE